MTNSENTYSTPQPIKKIDVDGKKISVFNIDKNNIDANTVKSFGEEWQKFDNFNSFEIESIGNEYFDIVPADILDKNKTLALDLGCGMGRWSIYLSDKVKFIEAIDPSEAIYSAARLCRNYPNINLSKASSDNIPFEDNYFDFAMSLGVLHHIPDTYKALTNLYRKIKPGGHCLIYLYYALDNRSSFYKFIFNVSNILRRTISTFSPNIKKLVCDLIAFTIYLPLIGLSYLTKFFGSKFYLKLPLSYYIGKSLHVIRNDSLDRFGTPLEKRFTKEEIVSMMHKAGFHELIFSDKMPYWHVLGTKKK